MAILESDADEAVDGLHGMAPELREILSPNTLAAARSGEAECDTARAAGRPASGRQRHA